MAKLEASHMISNGYVQSGAEMMGADISSSFSLSHVRKYSSSKLKGTSLVSKLVKSLVILIKFLMNHPLKLACPKNEQMSLRAWG